MHPTSTQWRQNQNRAITTEGFVELSYYFTDSNLQVSQIDTSPELTPVSQAYKVINQHTKPVTPFATLEHDLWLLDGSRVTIPETFPQVREFGGFISSDICGANGVFARPVVCNIFLREPAVILPGITIAWGTAFDEYPVDFSVVMLNENGAVVARRDVRGNNSIVTEVSLVMRRVRWMRIEVSRWGTGNRRARVGNIFLGHVRVYTKDNLLAFASSHEIDPVSGRLPKYEISFELDNRSGEFDPISDNSLYPFALERQEVTARYGFRRLPGDAVEWIPGGQYFLSDWAAPRNGLSASFKARDLLGFLDGIYYKGVYQGLQNPPAPSPLSGSIIGDSVNADDGGIIGEAPRPLLRAISLYDLAEEVLKDALPPHLGSRDKQWVISDSLKNFFTVSPLPIATHAECLQLIANAAGAALTLDREGILHIAPLPPFSQSGISNSLDDDNSYSRPEFELKRPLKSVQVSTYSWQAQEGEAVLYDHELQLEMGRNEFIAEYSDPAINVWVNHPIMHRPENSYELYARSASLVIHRWPGDLDRCRVVITGRVIRPAENTIVVMNNEDGGNRSCRGETLPLKNILITDAEHARTIANGLLARYGNRKNVSVDWRVDPSLDMGDFVALAGEQPQKTMRVLSTDLRFNGAFIGKSEGMVVQ